MYFAYLGSLEILTYREKPTKLYDFNLVMTNI
jgi:hypothetical protein